MDTTDMEQRFVPAPLSLRLAAMAYEAVLLFGVTFALSYALLASMNWSYPLGPSRARFCS